MRLISQDGKMSFDYDHTILCLVGRSIQASVSGIISDGTSLEFFIGEFYSEEDAQKEFDRLIDIDPDCFVSAKVKSRGVKNT